jgi:hypothetical protein
MCTGSGECETSTADSASTAPASQEFATGTNLHVNALGLLQFGLNPRLEMGGATTFLLGVHVFNTGVASYILLPGDDAYLNYGVGGNLGVRHYFREDGAQAGAYLGGFLEYAVIKTTDDEDDMAEYTRHVVVPGAEGGYRWVWGTFLLDVGALLGAAIPIVSEDEPIGDDGCVYEDSCLEEADPALYGMAVIDVGFFF